MDCKSANVISTTRGWRAPSEQKISVHPQWVNQKHGDFNHLTTWNDVSSFWKQQVCHLLLEHGCGHLARRNCGLSWDGCPGWRGGSSNDVYNVLRQAGLQFLLIMLYAESEFGECCICIYVHIRCSMNVRVMTMHPYEYIPIQIRPRVCMISTPQPSLEGDKRYNGSSDIPIEIYLHPPWLSYPHWFPVTEMMLGKMPNSELCTVWICWGYDMWQKTLLISTIWNHC